MSTATQVKRPWRTTVRTVVQFAIALATLLPFIAAGIYEDGDQAPAVVAQILAVAAAVTRIMALPQVEAFLRNFAPFLAAEPSPSEEAGAVSHDTLLLAILLGLILLVLLIGFHILRV